MAVSCSSLVLPLLPTSRSYINSPYVNIQFWGIETPRHNAGIPRLSMLCFNVLQRYWIFYRLKEYGNAVSCKSIATIIPTASAHFVCLWHFHNSCNSSHFFIIIFAMILWIVIFDIIIVLEQQNWHATEKLFMKGRSDPCDMPHCCLSLRNRHSYPNLQQPPPWSISSHQHWGKIRQKDTLTCWRPWWWLAFLETKNF